MKYISLFAGIGGFDLALNRLGHECVWASEWDKYAAQIYNKNFGNKESGEFIQGAERGGIQYRGDKSDTKVGRDSQPKTWGDRKFQQSKGIDTRDIRWDKYAAQIYEKNLSTKQLSTQSGGWNKDEKEKDSGHSAFTTSKCGGNTAKLCDTRDIRTVPTSEIPDHDLLVGGFPCQAFSIAGKRRGFDDTRGTLFFEIARILKDKNPKYFILENVKGLLSHDNGFTFKTIISTLTELGYDLQWQVLNSKNFGVPQNRERVFIVGHIRGQPRPEVFPITKGSRGFDEGNGTTSQAVITPTIDSRVGATTHRSPYIQVVGSLETDGWEKRHEQIRRVHGIDGISPTIPTGTGGGVMTKVAIPYVRNPYNGKQSETETGTLGTSCGTRTGKTAQLLHKDMRIRRLTPTECERLQGFPDGWTEKGISDTQRYKCLGNAVTVNVVYEVARRLNG